MIVGTASGNKKAKSLTVQTASGQVKAKAIWTMTASGLKRDSFGGISGTVTSLPSTIADPFDICAYSGSLYVSSGGDVIRKIDLSTGDASIFTYGEEDNYFSALRGICEYSGVIYACDGNIIWSVDISTAAVSIFAGWISPGDQTGIGTAARFDTPTGICAYNGYLYVTDSGNNKIKRIQISNANVTHFSGSGVAGNAVGTSSTAQFNSSQDIDYYGGYLYVTDISVRGVRTVDLSNGSVTSLNQLAGIAEDRGFSGVCAYDGRINWFDLYTVFSSRYLENSADYYVTAGYIPDGVSTPSGDIDGAGDEVRFNKMRGVCQYLGDFYICDSENNKIRKMVY